MCTRTWTTTYEICREWAHFVECPWKIPCIRLTYHSHYGIIALLSLRLIPMSLYICLPGEEEGLVWVEYVWMGLRANINIMTLACSQLSSFYFAFLFVKYKRTCCPAFHLHSIVSRRFPWKLCPLVYPARLTPRTERNPSTKHSMKIYVYDIHGLALFKGK